MSLSCSLKKIYLLCSRHFSTFLMFVSIAFVLLWMISITIYSARQFQKIFVVKRGYSCHLFVEWWLLLIQISLIFEIFCFMLSIYISWRRLEFLDNPKGTFFFNFKSVVVFFAHFFPCKCARVLLSQIFLLWTAVPKRLSCVFSCHF